MNINAAIDLMIALITQMQRVSSIIQLARAEGRDTLNDAELDELRAVRDEAHTDLERAIDQARAEGR